MKKLISTLLTIIFFQTQVFSISVQPNSVLLPANNSVIQTSVKDKSVFLTSVIPADSSSVIPADSHSSVIPAEQLSGNLSEINTKQSLSGLNRDIFNTQTITKDEATRALNIDTTIDLRWLSGEGRKEIWNDLKKAPKNLNQIGKNITKNNIIVQSVKNAITDEDINIIEAIKDYIKTDKQIKNIQADKGTTETLNGATNYSVEEVKGALQEVANTSLDGSNAEVTVYNNESGIESKGYSYIGKDGTKIGLNTETTDITNSGDIINTMYHEATHINKGASEKTATNYGNTAQSIWDMYNFGNENTNIITGEQWNERNITDIGFIEGNNIALTNYNNSKLGFGIFNERVTEYSRDLDGVPVGKHSFLLLEPDNMNDFTEEKMKQMGLDTNKFKFIDIGNNRKGIIVGAYEVDGKLKANINYNTDVKTVQGYKNNETKTYLNPETRIIQSKKDDTTFIYSILNNTSNYIKNTEIEPIGYGYIFSNCNSFTNRLLDHSGADLNRNRDMRGRDPGKNSEFYKSVFKLKETNICK